MGDIHHDRIEVVFRKLKDKENEEIHPSADGRPTTESPQGKPYSDDPLLERLFKVYGKPRK